MKKKLEINAKTLGTAAGVILALGSSIAIADYIDRKARGKRSAHTAELVLGIAGVVAGAGLTIGVNRPARHKIIVEDMFEDDELDLAHEQIRETLNTGVERGVFAPDYLSDVAADEEPATEDFI